MKQENTADYKKLYEETLLESDRQLNELRELGALNQQLLHRLDLLLRSAYGSKSERFPAGGQNPAQMRLELQQEVPVEQTGTAKKTKKQHRIARSLKKKVQAFRNS